MQQPKPAVIKCTCRVCLRIPSDHEVKENHLRDYNNYYNKLAMINCMNIIQTEEILENVDRNCKAD